SPHFFISLPPRHPPSTLFPYTTLFRSLPFVPRLASRAIRLKHSQELREVDVDAPHKRGQSHFSSYCWCIFILAHKAHRGIRAVRSEEHTSELQSPCNLVCRLLLEKKKK